MAIGKSTFPKWAECFLDEKDLAKVSEAIKKAEDRADGELVPVVVRSSTPLHGVMTVCLLFCAALFGFLQMHYFPQYETGGFAGAMLAALVVGFVIAHVPVVQRTVLPDLDEEKAVHERAELEFYRLGVHQTVKKTGILIFISLLEKKVVILADQGISDKLPPETWSKIVVEAVRGIRKGKLGDGLIHCIEACGEHLASHFPHPTEKKDELRNELVFKD